MEWLVVTGAHVTLTEDEGFLQRHSVEGATVHLVLANRILTGDDLGSSGRARQCPGITEDLRVVADTHRRDGHSIRTQRALLESRAGMDHLHAGVDSRRSHRANTARHTHRGGRQHSVNDHVLASSGDNTSGLEHGIRQDVLGAGNREHGVRSGHVRGKLQLWEDHAFNPEAMLDLLGSFGLEQRSQSQQRGHAVGHVAGDVEAEGLLSEVGRIVVGCPDTSRHENLLRLKVITGGRCRCCGLPQ